MTRDDIIRMAREALEECDGEDYYDYTHNKIHWWGEAEAIIKFANLVAETERNACAALCFQMWNTWMDSEDKSEFTRPDAEDCAAAIRTRGLTSLRRQLIDAGALQSDPAGLKARGQV